MGLFSNQQNENRSNGTENRYRPTESAQVNATTIVDLWVNEQGASSWGLSRVNLNGGRSFRTMKAEQLGDAVEGLAVLANVFAKQPNCPVDMKAYYSELNGYLEIVVEKLKGSIRQAENGETTRSGLLAA